MPAQWPNLKMPLGRYSVVPFCDVYVASEGDFLGHQPRSRHLKKYNFTYGKQHILALAGQEHGLQKGTLKCHDKFGKKTPNPLPPGI